LLRLQIQSSCTPIKYVVIVFAASYNCCPNRIHPGIALVAMAVIRLAIRGGLRCGSVQTRQSNRTLQIRPILPSTTLHARVVVHQGYRFNSSSSATTGAAKDAKAPSPSDGEKSDSSSTTSSHGSIDSSVSDATSPSQRTPSGWEDEPDWTITKFSELPHAQFGYNQHMQINEEFKECLRQMLWQFRAPIRYAFAYGSGVFSQSNATKSSPSNVYPHPKPPEAIVKWQRGGGKVIDFIFGVSHTQHWHSINMQQHPEHYSFLRRFGSGLVSRVQDDWGAGVYFNPYITVNGTMIKYGVVNLDTLQKDLSNWDTLYLAGRLHKPVKILRDDPKVRLANQINLISALRTALLMLGPKFTEQDLYTKIAGISYMGDPRMDFRGEDPNKVRNIVANQLPNFRQLYAPLVEELPNVQYTDARCKSNDWFLDTQGDYQIAQDMDTKRRGNMVRRLPVSFRSKIYMEYRKKWQIPGAEFNRMMKESQDEDAEGFKRREGGKFDQRIANEDDLKDTAVHVIRQTVRWPSWSQSTKGFLTAGPSRSWKYLGEKRAKGRQPKEDDKKQE
jgi:mitochondrial translocator assembly and maintenance protein 41